MSALILLSIFDNTSFLCAYSYSVYTKYLRITKIWLDIRGRNIYSNPPCMCAKLIYLVLLKLLYLLLS